MNALLNKIQTNYGYTDYEIALIKYVLVSIASELSKLFILVFFYIYVGKFSLFAFSFLLLFLLRVNGGGFHCKHYITCLLLTFIISVASILLLPQIEIYNFSIVIFTLLLCLILNYIIGPIASPFRPRPDKSILLKCKNNGFIVILVFIIMVSIFNTIKNVFPFFIVGYWTIILHTVQLIIAKLLQKGGRANEKT